MNRSVRSFVVKCSNFVVPDKLNLLGKNLRFYLFVRRLSFKPDEPPFQAFKNKPIVNLITPAEK